MVIERWRLVQAFEENHDLLECARECGVTQKQNRLKTMRLAMQWMVDNDDRVAAMPKGW